MNAGYHIECIEITEVVHTTDRCVIARAKDTGKLINLPRRITRFYPGRAIVPHWFACKIRRGEPERPRYDGGSPCQGT